MTLLLKQANIWNSCHSFVTNQDSTNDQSNQSDISSIYDVKGFIVSGFSNDRRFSMDCNSVNCYSESERQDKEDDDCGFEQHFAQFKGIGSGPQGKQRNEPGRGRGDKESLRFAVSRHELKEKRAEVEELFEAVKVLRRELGKQGKLEALLERGFLENEGYGNYGYGNYYNGNNYGGNNYYGGNNGHDNLGFKYGNGNDNFGREYGGNGYRYGGNHVDDPRQNFSRLESGWAQSRGPECKHAPECAPAPQSKSNIFTSPAANGRRGTVRCGDYDVHIAKHDMTVTLTNWKTGQKESHNMDDPHLFMKLANK